MSLKSPHLANSPSNPSRQHSQQVRIFDSFSRSKDQAAMAYCTAKAAFLQGLRPTPHQRISLLICSRPCIFCDIWRLATLLNNHVPLSVRHAASSIHRLQQQDSVVREIEKRIQIQLQQQRGHVTSMMSICTVDGVEDSEGLYIAFERCFDTVQQLLYEEANLEEQLLRPSVASRRTSETATGCLEYENLATCERRNAIAA